MMHSFLLDKNASESFFTLGLDKTNERSEVAGKMKPYAILDVEQCYQLWQHTGIFWRDLKNIVDRALIPNSEKCI